MSSFDHMTATYPRRINLGCGYDIRDGYLNVDTGDWHKPDLVADITDLSQLPEGYFELAVAQDVLEHIPRTRQIDAMKAWSRILKDRGLLEVRVPSIVDLVQLLNDPMFDTLEQQHYWVQMVHGTQAYVGDFHLCAYTPMTLIDLGRRSGLLLVKVSIKDRWLFELVYKKCSNEDELDHLEWLTTAYMWHARRIPDLQGLNYWQDVLNKGAMSRNEVAHTLSLERARC